MSAGPQHLAELLGAKVVGEVPDVGGGPFGMARLAHLMHRRLTPSQGERPGRPTDVTWACRPKVPMSAATRRRLAELAAAMSTPERRVSPMQLAAQLLELAVNEAQVPTTTGDRGDSERAGAPSEVPSPTGRTKAPKTRTPKRNRRAHT
jgi:hypothetical protein